MEQTACTAMQARIAAIRARMEDAARRAGRNPQEIRLCAACKTQETETVRASAHMAIDLFGENHVQELVEKYDAGAYEGKEVHFIGHLQTNKVKKVVGRADVIESVDSQRLLDVIEREAEKQNRTQTVFLEVNIGGEASKSGVAPDELLPLCILSSPYPGHGPDGHPAGSHQRGAEPRFFAADGRVVPKSRRALSARCEHAGAVHGNERRL